ncbi:MAG: hypothetical protein JW882_18490 [Deltaproteobacteria bacterium]|nr:hypothetical protein [Deltaproteobacteria bacterium]
MNIMEPKKTNGNNGWTKNHRHLTSAKITRIIGWVIVGVVIACFFAFMFGILVKWLWGVTLTPLFNLPQPTYWQAVGLIILGKLLFGGIGHPHKDSDHPFPHKKGHDHFDGHFGGKTHSPDRMGSDAAYWGPYREFWEKEGRKAFEEYLNSYRSTGDEQSR